MLNPQRSSTQSSTTPMWVPIVFVILLGVVWAVLPLVAPGSRFYLGRDDARQAMKAAAMQVGRLNLVGQLEIAGYPGQPSLPKPVVFTFFRMDRVMPNQNIADALGARGLKKPSDKAVRLLLKNARTVLGSKHPILSKYQVPAQMGTSGELRLVQYLCDAERAFSLEEIPDHCLIIAVESPPRGHSI